MELMKRRREILAQGNGLPSAYRRVEYLESSGTQYIDTGFSGTLNTEVIADFSNFNGLSSRYAGAFGQIGSSNTSVINASIGAQGVYASFGNQIDKINYQSSWAGRTLLRINKDGLEENGVQKGTFSNVTFVENNKIKIYLFARCYSNATADRLAQLRLYSAIIKDNGVPVRNLIPCIRKSDSEAGMYDTVSHTFYTNAGTGEFITPPVDILSGAT